MSALLRNSDRISVTPSFLMKDGREYSLTCPRIGRVNMSDCFSLLIFEEAASFDSSLHHTLRFQTFVEFQDRTSAILNVLTVSSHWSMTLLDVRSYHDRVTSDNLLDSCPNGSGSECLCALHGNTKHLRDKD